MASDNPAPHPGEGEEANNPVVADSTKAAINSLQGNIVTVKALLATEAAKADQTEERKEMIADLARTLDRSMKLLANITPTDPREVGGKRKRSTRRRGGKRKTRRRA